FLDAAELSMLVIDENGKIVRIMAVPQPGEVNYLIGGPFGTPGVDPQGRLVYRARVGGFSRFIPTPRPGQPPVPQLPDSAMVVRFDLASRKVDTAAKFVTPTIGLRVTKDENGWTTTTRIVNPIPWTDDWALLSDGSVAIIHGREYRVDFVDESGRVTSTPKQPFDWQPLTDED